MLGNLIGSIVIGVAVALALYFIPVISGRGEANREARLRNAVVIGAGVAILGFILRWLGWL